MKKSCAAYEGCRQLGWVYDLEDSGSGATVYCDCAAGEELKAKEHSTIENAPDAPAPQI